MSLIAHELALIKQVVKRPQIRPHNISSSAAIDNDMSNTKKLQDIVSVLLFLLNNNINNIFHLSLTL